MRLATMEDAKRLLDWRNERSARAMFGDTCEVALDSHVSWLRDRLSRTTEPFFIGEVEGVAFGYVRFDRNDDGYEVSIGLDVTRRGSGLAAPLLSRACRKVSEESGCSRIVARVRPENYPSQRLFERCGFRSLGLVGDMVVYRFEAGIAGRAG